MKQQELLNMLQELKSQIAAMQGGKAAATPAATATATPTPTPKLLGMDSKAWESALREYIPAGVHQVTGYIGTRGSNAGKSVVSISRGFGKPSLVLSVQGEADLTALAVRVRALKDGLQADLDMIEGVERYIAAQLQK